MLFAAIKPGFIEKMIILGVLWVELLGPVHQPGWLRSEKSRVVTLRFIIAEGKGNTSACYMGVGN